MRLFRLLATVVVFSLLAGCVSANDPKAVAQNTQVNFNPHTGMREVSGAISPINGNILQGLYMLRAFNSAHQLYLSVSSSEWLFLNAAYAYGQPLSFTAIDRQVSSCSRYGCNITETVGVNLTVDDLRRFAQTGFEFQLSGQRGSRVISVPATYFQGYLAKIGN